MIPKILHFFSDPMHSELKLKLILDRYKSTYKDYKIVFWNEKECSEFIVSEYPQYSDLYLRKFSTHNIAHLIKFLVLYKHGGVYFNPDLFPLRNISGLLYKKTTLLSFEPLKVFGPFSKNRIVSDLFLACTSQNSFVEEIIKKFIILFENKHIYENQRFNLKTLLTLTFDNYEDKSDVIIIRSKYFQPFTKNETNKFNESFADKIKYAYSVRLYNENADEFDLQKKIPNILLMYNKVILDVFPLISCMCVSNNNEEFVKRCIKSFNDQLYENKELVIIYENSSLASDFMNSISQSNIFIYNESGRKNKKTLGALRNIAIHKSSGQFVMQWDDDDIYDPHRIFEQYIHMNNTKSDACLLDQVTIFDEIKNRFALSKKREWEGSIIFNRELSIANNLWYPELTKGEDTLFVEKFKSEFTIAQLSEPFLYLYVTHKNNTFNYLHHFQLTKTVFRIFKTYLKPDDKKLHYFKSFTN